ncbi:MAG: YeeE/YedE family protein [Deltaproteobacteria bacterium]|nr:YeeE/YedE family protein [Deltaproteobacteria bacterium]
MAGASITLRAFLREQYEKVFRRPWPVLTSALVIASLNVFLFAFDRPWTASDGIRNWGDWLSQSVGILKEPELLSPFLHSGSVLNLGLLLGAFAAALLSREFGIRTAPAAELVKGALGGVMMGWGAVLSFGCNIGGFFSALSALSLSGLAVMLGLGAGAFLGTRYLSWETRNMPPASSGDFQSPCEPPPQATPSSASFGLQPLIGLLVFFALIGAGYIYRRLGHTPQATVLLFGVAFGVILQRSRFCLVRAFREPFMSGESEHTRAAAVALTLSMIGFSILKATDLKDATEWVFPSFWLGAFLGGSLFGVGMVIAGGCGAGSIWRAAEGHIKLWVAVFFFAVGASMMRLFLVRTELLRELGSALFLPSLLGWTGAVWSVAALMAVWYLLAGWNEQRRRP